MNRIGFAPAYLRRGPRARLALAALAALVGQSVPATAQLATTRNDFHAPGTQPLSVTDNFATPDTCAPCHSNYGSPQVEPFRNWAGSMMAQSGRDPLMWAALAIANQDAPHSGETCLRCHLPKGWLEGRSVPEDGTMMTADDRQGVQCSVCHRLVDPVSRPENPAEDAAILAALTEPVPAFGSAMMVVDPLDRRRGPFDVIADLGFEPHVPDATTLVSPFHTRAEMCGTCHDVFNPAFTRDSMTGEYVLGPLDTPSADVSTGFPEQATFSEWAASEYASTGVYAPQFGLNQDTVSTCQGCHVPDVSGKDANLGVQRTDLPLHQFRGANTFIPKVLPQHPAFGSEVDANLLQETVEIATDFLRKASSLSLDLSAGNLTIRVTNETGHKLPTGYPEGRRMWLHVRAFDADRNVVFESGRYIFATGELVGFGAAPADPDYDPYLHVWETVQGISPALALLLGTTPGPSFHLALNNVVEFDNRIPPRGFTYAAFEAFGGQPVGQAYADGQYWDDVVYPVGTSAANAEVTLYYQTASAEYVAFLRDENVTNAAGPIIFDLWDQSDKAAPVAMARAYYEPDTQVVARCQNAISRAQLKHSKKTSKEWAKCFQVEAEGLTCDTAGRNAKLAASDAKLADAIGGAKDKRCVGASLTPISLGHGPVCPVPCASQNLFDMNDEGACAACMVDALTAAALNAAYGVTPPQLPVTAPSGAPATCQKRIAKSALGLAKRWAQALARCENDNRTGRNNPPQDCSTDPGGRITKAKATVDKKIASCKDFSGLAGCASSGTLVDAQGCVKNAIGAVVGEFTEVAYP